MLARLQQLLTLGALFLALGWATVWWQANRPGLAVAGLAVVLFGHAAVLGFEFMLLRRAHGDDDPTTRASARELLQAWWTESHAALKVFCWRQPFRSRRWPDYLPPHAQGRRGVLLVHGFVCNRGLWNPWLAKLTASEMPVVAVNLEPVFGSIDHYIGGIDAAVLRLEAATGMAPVVVAHSMGGLAVRAWYARQADPARLHRVITLATPHRGTWLARFAFSANGRQMRRASPWLQALAARETAAHRARFTCLYSACDNIVFPPATAVLPGAGVQQHVPGVPHVHLAERPEAWAALEAALAR